MYFVLGSIPVIAAVMFSTWLALEKNGADWGSVGEWAGAFGTIGAVGVALAIAILDARRRASDRKDEQAAQARLITVDARADTMGGVLYVSVTNHSTSPIFAVAIDAVHVTPDPLRVSFRNDHEWPRIDAGESKTSTCLLFEMDGITSAAVAEPSIASADVSFVDSAGLRWRRWGNTAPRGGAPIRHSEPPKPVADVPALREL